MEDAAPPQRVQKIRVSHLHRRDLVHLCPHQLDAVQDLLLVASQRHPHPEDVPEEKTQTLQQMSNPSAPLLASTPQPGASAEAQSPDTYSMVI